MVHHHNFNALLALLEGAKRQKLKIDGWLGLTIFNNRVGDLFFSLTARFNPIKRRFTILSCFFGGYCYKKMSNRSSSRRRENADELHLVSKCWSKPLIAYKENNVK